MKIKNWLNKHTQSLAGRRVAIFGATGGIGRALCRYLAALGADLLLLDRNTERSDALRRELEAEYPGLKTAHIRVDLEDMNSVRAACDALRHETVDVLIHNAGAYKIPRRITEAGYDNAFQINFAAPYCLTRALLPELRRQGTRVVTVGSIAHRYGKLDEADIDGRHRTRASRVYGNAKRFLMCAMWGLFDGEQQTSLSVVHPGISKTGITAHYPPLLYALIKYPMTLIFMRPRKACLSVLAGVFEACGTCEWIGPRVADVWGYPKKQTLHSCDEAERTRICEIAEACYARFAAGDAAQSAPGGLPWEAKASD